MIFVLCIFLTTLNANLNQNKLSQTFANGWYYNWVQKIAFYGINSVGKKTSWVFCFVQMSLKMLIKIIL